MGKKFTKTTGFGNTKNGAPIGYKTYQEFAFKSMVKNGVRNLKVATQEILITNPAVQNQIREDKVHQIYSQMQLNQKETNMTTQTQEIISLLQKRVINKENAIKNSNKPEELMKLIEGL